MTIEEHFAIVRAFEAAFGETTPPPAWSDCKPLDAAIVLRAIASVKANPLSKHNRQKASLVIRVATAKRRRSKPSMQPRYPRTEATK